MSWTEIDGSSTAGVGSLLPWTPAFNVKSAPYNATGNNTTDDATAIQAALTAAAAAGGGVVFLPNATGYLIGTKLSIGSNVILRGEGYGSYLNLSALATGVEASSTNRTGIENLRIGGTSAQGIRYASTTQSWIRNCWISGVTLGTAPAGERTAGIYARGGSDLSIEGNFLSGNGFGTSNTVDSEDIMVDFGCSRLKISGNRCSSTAVTMNIIAESNSGGAVLQDVLIERNIVSGAISSTDNSKWGYGIAVYKNTFTVSRVIVRGNIISTTGGNGIYFAGVIQGVAAHNILADTVKTMTGGALVQGAIGIDSDGSEITVHGNVIDTCVKVGIRIDSNYSTVSSNNITTTTGIGIAAGVGLTDIAIVGNRLTTTAGGGIALTAATSTHVVIDGNVINGATGGAGSYGIQINGGTYVTVSNNQINSVGAYGIQCQTCVRGSIIGNTVKDAGQATNNTYSGIFVAGSSTDILVEGNSSFNTVGTGAKYGIGVDTSTNIDVRNNNVRTNVTAGINFASPTACTASGNRYSAGAMKGTATLDGASPSNVTVNTAEIQAADNVRLTRITAAGTIGNLSAPAASIVAGTSFLISSTANAETSTVFWEIVH